MMQLSFMFSLMMTTFLFTQMNHPLSMGLILLFQTVFISIFTGLISKTFWFSYILFLIFVGSMLILFIYMSSLSSNEKMVFSPKTLMKSLMFIIFLLLIFYYDKFFTTFFNSQEMNNQMDLLTLINENYLNLSKLYEFPNNFMTIMMIMYLLLTLIVVVKITNSFMGPLRQKNYE